MIYFAWIEKDEIFNPQKHARLDIPLLSVSIQHKENSFAFAKIQTVFASLPLKKYVFISYKQANGEIVLLFRGGIWNTPTKFNAKILQFECIAKAEDAEQKIEKIHQDLQKTPHWDPLFLSKFQKDCPAKSLESQSVLYCWSRTDTALCLSDIFQGRIHKKIGTRIWDETLDLVCTKIPLKSITVYVEAAWTQHHNGIIDIGKFLKNRLPLGMISSFTGTDLQKRWATIGKSFHKSGYKILYHSLKEISDLPQSLLNLYPSTSPLLKENTDGNLKDVYLKRFWLSPELVVAWQYFQQRKETVKITLKNSVQDLEKSGRHHQLFLKLNPLCADRPLQIWERDKQYALFDLVCYQSRMYRCYKATTTCPPSVDWKLEDQPIGLKNPAQSTFFLTPRGHQAVAHAIDIARAHLAASSRAIKITFKTDWDVLQDISLDHTLTIQDPRLPGGQATGKVVEYQFFAEKEQRWLHVVLLCSVGQPSLEPEQPDICEKSYSQTGYLHVEDIQKTPYGIVIPRFEEQIPAQGISAPWALKIHDFIQQIKIENTADHQLKTLQTSQGTTIASKLKTVPTRIYLPLKSLATQLCLHHTITLDISQPWSPPCQILLKRG